MKTVFVLFLIGAILASGQPTLRGFEITIENLSGGSLLPSALSEVVWAVHSQQNPLYTPGQYASLGLETLAEDGNGTRLVNESKSAPGVSSAGVKKLSPIGIAGIVPVGGIPIGSTVHFGVYAKPGDRFSFVSMFWESNDNFFGTPTSGIPLFDDTGLPISGTYQTILFDAGTEINEAPGAGINQGPRQVENGIGRQERKPVMQQNLGSQYPESSTVLRLTITAATLFRVRLENLGNFTAFSPPVWAASHESNVLFTPGATASAGLEKLAEEGNGALLLSQLQATQNVVFSGIGTTSAISPGNYGEWTVPATPGTALFLASMYGKSNDRFFAPQFSGIKLFVSSGPLSDVDVEDIILWDAGTEVNQTPGTGAGQPANGGAGTAESSVVKTALGNPDSFKYPYALRLSITPLTDAPGFTASNPNQNVYVNFQFANLFRV